MTARLCAALSHCDVTASPLVVLLQFATSTLLPLPSAVQFLLPQLCRQLTNLSHIPVFNNPNPSLSHNFAVHTETLFLSHNFIVTLLCRVAFYLRSGGVRRMGNRGGDVKSERVKQDQHCADIASAKIYI